MCSKDIASTTKAWVASSLADVPLVEFMYLIVFTCMPGESYHKWLRWGLCCACVASFRLWLTPLCVVSAWVLWASFCFRFGSLNMYRIVWSSEAVQHSIRIASNNLMKFWYFKRNRSAFSVDDHKTSCLFCYFVGARQRCVIIKITQYDWMTSVVTFSWVCVRERDEWQV